LSVPPRPESEPRDAAVLVPVYRDVSGDARVVLVRRAEGGPHGGQLAFPGGARETGDASLLDTALREAEEEIGLERAAVTVLAELEPVNTRVSGYLVTPYLARIRRPERWRVDPLEVAEVLEPRLADLARPETHGEAMESFSGWLAPVKIGFFRVGPHRLWGASYRMFRPLLPRLLAGEWEI
jgi:8-oxo-dGTP pyrophosphatase MutT (NUDIX family)